MSNKREREKRREERVAAEQQVSTEDRRTRLLQFGAGAVFLVIVAVVVLIVANSGGSSSGGDPNDLNETAQVNKLLAGTPQENLIVGNPKAKVNLIEFGDLQCPVCKAFSEEVLPEVIENKVRNGKAKITFRNFTIIGPESLPAGAAAIAAGRQGRGWTFLELFYRNQGDENSGYVTDEFLTSIAKGAGVKDMAQWESEREEPDLREEVEGTTEQAETFGFSGTPSFAIEGPSTKGVELLGTPSAAGEIEEAIEKAS
jgi:protein-disulfide isomerase